MLEEEGPLGNLDLFDVERIAIVVPKIADPVDEDVIAGSESTHGQVVSRSSPTFSRLQADAWHVAKNIRKRVRVLLANNLLGNHGQGLGNLRNGLLELRRCQVLRLVKWFFLINDAVSFDDGFIENCVALCCLSLGFIRSGEGNDSSRKGERATGTT